MIERMIRFLCALHGHQARCYTARANAKGDGVQVFVCRCGSVMDAKPVMLTDEALTLYAVTCAKPGQVAEVMFPRGDVK